jgi:hypothetical protein
MTSTQAASDTTPEVDLGGSTDDELDKPHYFIRHGTPDVSLDDYPDQWNVYEVAPRDGRHWMARTTMVASCPEKEAAEAALRLLKS